MFVQRCISVESAREPGVVFMLADNMAAQHARLSYFLTPAPSVAVLLGGCTCALDPRLQQTSPARGQPAVRRLL